MAPDFHTLRTVAVTAVVTSAAWVVAGALWMNGAVPTVGSVEPERLPMAARPPLPGQAASRPASSAKVRSLSEPALRIPVAGVQAEQLADTFSQAREQGLRSHDAIDIPAPRGTPVLAAAAGRVEKLFLSKPGGKTIYIRSGDGRRIYYYAHLDQYAPSLAEGQQVSAGQVLGAVGSTGNADPSVPHLHFAVMQTDLDARWWEPALAINPYPLLRGR